MKKKTRKSIKRKIASNLPLIVLALFLTSITLSRLFVSSAFIMKYQLKIMQEYFKN